MTSTQLKQTIVNSFKLEDYDISRECGFLPKYSPALAQLPQMFTEVQKTAAFLPKWMTTRKIRQVIKQIPEVDVEQETLDEMQLRRVMQVYSYLTHAYVWGESIPANVLPRNIAVPFCKISQRIGRPPILSYASYTLDNWIRIDEAKPIEIGNIILWQNFLGGLDEDWFILIHIEIEAKAAPALAVIPPLLEGIAHNDTTTAINALQDIKDAWTNINATMSRMPEACDPYIYYNRVRPYIHGWKNNPALPEGLVYAGVEAYEEKPQQFRGSTGAQSSIIPTMDALFNIVHENDPLLEFLIELREYMPPQHRAFIKEVQKRSTLRDFVKTHMDSVPNLKDLYNDCVSLIEEFRTMHLEFAARYIHQQTAKSNNNTEVGTGGTPFMRYLKKHRDEAVKHLLK